MRQRFSRTWIGTSRIRDTYSKRHPGWVGERQRIACERWNSELLYGECVLGCANAAYLATMSRGDLKYEKCLRRAFVCRALCV